MDEHRGPLEGIEVFESNDEECGLCDMMGLRWSMAFDELERLGLSFRDPAELNSSQASEELWKLIHGLERLRVFVEQTDHLSDESLYQHLWARLHEDSLMMAPDDPYGATHLDILGGYSEDDIVTWLTYHADDQQRDDWARQFPDDPMPARQQRPFDRDRHLPRREWPVETEH